MLVYYSRTGCGGKLCRSDLHGGFSIVFCGFFFMIVITYVRLYDDGHGVGNCAWAHSRRRRHRQSGGGSSGHTRE